jgi:hypothetical protein
MPKPLKIRETSNPIGLKFHEVMAEKGISGDYKAVADAFGVKTPSVYDWIDHARIAKDKFRRLVEWSGRSLHWWFDIDPAIEADEPKFLLREKSAIYNLKQPDPWPFTRSFQDYAELSELDKGRVDGYMTGLIDARKGDRELGKSNGTVGGF